MMLEYPSYIFLPGYESDEMTIRLIAQLQEAVQSFSARRMNAIFHEFSVTEAEAVSFDSPNYEPKFELRESETTCQLETIDGRLNLVVKVYINKYKDEHNDWVAAGAALINQLDTFRGLDFISTILHIVEARIQQDQPQVEDEDDDAGHQMQL